MVIDTKFVLNPTIIWHSHKITRQDREKLHKHHGMVFWFTGLSGSGKSTIAGALEQVLYERGISTYLLDGDNIRHGLCRDLTFNENDRRENIRRVGEVLRLMVDAGIVILTALISPYQAERQLVRNMIQTNRFVEIFVDTPITVCESRDPKGLYQKARAGKLLNFTGIDSSYETPTCPDLHLNGEESITNLIDLLLKTVNKHINVDV